MRFFSVLYDKAMGWSRHRHASRWLVLVSFTESSFFVVPPDVMLAPMSLACPNRAWRYALLTTVASVLGGVLGYGIGALAFSLVEPLLHQLDYWDAYLKARLWFENWGGWAVLLAGFSPVPYKVFTIAAGVVAMPLLPFTLASLAGRGARFFLVAALMRWGGVRMEAALQKYVDIMGWVAVVIAIVGYLLWSR
ncbi:YqaA family protein [Nitrosococcus wardiae]|uniref:DedA family protein n=1 Tax=Nitrosococcus wardiae TaxID=1814290 RepID=A0A4P7BZP8_9GAMM|nr:YqaA family protein [Nitrosococcus wardiae]QBQ54700.1 DedA family protein [Nitrosococcus wardiae]